jgi:hypothetical protein
VPALGQQGPYGTVRLTAGQGGVLTGTPFAPDKATRYFAGGIEPLFIVDGEGQKIDALPRFFIETGCNQDDGLPVADGYGTVSLSSELARLDNKVATTNVTIER